MCGGDSGSTPGIGAAANLEKPKEVTKPSGPTVDVVTNDARKNKIPLKRLNRRMAPGTMGKSKGAPGRRERQLYHPASSAIWQLQHSN